MSVFSGPDMRPRNLLLSVMMSGIFIMSTSRAGAQQVEYGLQLGTTQFLGEMGIDYNGAKDFFRDIGQKLSKPAVGGFIRFRKRRIPFLGFKTNFLYGVVSGDDRSSNNMTRRWRNLQFRSNIVELSNQIEFFAIIFRNNYGERYFLQGVSRRILFELSAYGFTGVGLFYFNPQATYQGTTYDLRDMHTEGQGFTAGREVYSLYQLNIPMGIGLRWRLGKMSLSVEIGYRKTFTDYMDDVSTTYVDSSEIAAHSIYRGTAAALARRSPEYTNDKVILLYSKPGAIRGNPRSMDAYVFTVAGISYTIKYHFRRRSVSRY